MGEEQTLKKKSYFHWNNQLNIPEEGVIPLYKDQKALEAYYQEEIEANSLSFASLEEKIDYLLKNDYLEEELINKYLEPAESDQDRYAFIKRMYQFLENKNFKFKSFMGAYKFYNQYALKTNDGRKYLESFVDRVAMNALYLADGDRQLALDIAEELISQRYQPATPTFLNAGKKRRGEMVSCFLLDVDDSMLSIGRAINSALQLSRKGGGVGVNLSNIRAAGDPIKSIENASSGVVPVMKLLEDSFSYSNQLGQRNGAGVVYLNVFHPDILAFLSCKKENADEKIRVKTLSLGVVVPDKFYDLVKHNEAMYLFSPYDIEKEYGVPFSYFDLSENYQDLVDNPNIRKKKIQARELETEISKLQQESGYPYIINIDTVNRANPVEGKVIMSNLCSEIFQVQEPSILNDDLSYQKLGSDISCNLASTNMEKMLKSPDFGKSVEVAVRALTTVSDKTKMKEVPTVQNGNDLYHTIGLGAMGFHTLLAKNKIVYGSKASIEIIEAYFIGLNYYSLLASNKIAQEKGEAFHNFEKSKYADGSYFLPYLEEDFTFQEPAAAELFKNIQLPTRADWQTLAERVKKHGLYHRNRLAVAPNGSISYLNETSASLHPITHRMELRQEQKNGAIYYPAPGLSNETLPYYQTAYEMDQRRIIDVYAAAQKHIDQGMSLTLFMLSELPEGIYEWKQPGINQMTTRDLNILRHYAFSKGIKSLYYVRTHSLDGDVIGANQCESCMI
ncbi:class 1b ribonucleoside-diphosphate reductase subunit alpha [Facklamia miroungae]|uniref:Ribonucleoside-diphosphate reductase n=1 Tax=Facklamia miroungae TaxID=120956 RepID=A0A1G7QPH9_9LACT|nr:class 1b ribonucleoside-diphosphate reductase subunit alpha [Facklamia miroungae]NKZ29019.1 class 1b ribonucleoside-diphosphate reductase subunit alpha [Facklamia miroungae]SDG00425.1 ribonucleoside-diphosphate reductase alpha chain [Facklamia miroungae]